MTTLPLESCKRMIEREFPQSSTRLTIYAPPRRSRLRRWLRYVVLSARQCLSLMGWLFLGLCGLYVSIAGVIGFVVASAIAIGDLFRLACRLVGLS